MARREAKRGGELLAANGVELDRAFTSVLTRAIRTSDLALTVAGQLWIPMEKHWRLNERHYGGLTGMNKAETAAKLGEAQVKIWRRSYDIPPPPLPPGGEFDLSSDRRYAGVEVPATETLKSTLERVRPYWDQKIVPSLAAGERLIIAAHGNSLRAIVKVLFKVSDEAIPAVEIPTGNPLLLDLAADLTPRSARYLDPGRAEALPASSRDPRGRRAVHMRRAIELAPRPPRPDRRQSGGGLRAGQGRPGDRRGRHRAGVGGPTRRNRPSRRLARGARRGGFRHLGALRRALQRHGLLRRAAGRGGGDAGGVRPPQSAARAFGRSRAGAAR